MLSLSLCLPLLHRLLFFSVGVLSNFLTPSCGCCIRLLIARAHRTGPARCPYLADLTGFQFRAQRPSPAEAFSRASLSDSGERSTLPISTVHVDNNMKDHRTSTVIMYMTSVPESGVLLQLNERNQRH